ncbi:AMP-binding protein [Actinomadura fulvescens]|uniref:AMP-dependent synthetase/ligase domain-containing protein n=1 Tax=Actinomadura fulvescens TaxID=46160 RepID=A0ABP6BVR5_9ACTN
MAYPDRHPRDDAGRLAVAETTVTGAVLETAREMAVRRGERAALRDPHETLSYSRFAAVVPAAAAGLRRQGVRPGDLGAVHLGRACDVAVAVHSITAAGAVPVLLPPGATAGELAALMSESGARFLLTGGALAPVSMAATERSYVRQVFTFGEVAGATPFARLVADGGAGAEPAGLAAPPVDPLRDLALRLGDPREDLTHADRLADLYRLAGAVGITECDVLACRAGDVPMPTWIGLIDLCLAHGATFVGAADVPEGAALLTAVERNAATIAVVSPAGLRALAYDHDAAPRAGLRLLVTGAADPEVVRACRDRHGWTVSPLA